MKELGETSNKKKRKKIDLDDDDDIEGAPGVRKRLKKGKPDYSKKKFKNKKRKK